MKNLYRFCANSKKIALIALCFSIASLAFSLEVPPLQNPVMDMAGIISSQTEMQINSECQKLSSETGIQFAILTIKSLQGESLEEYSLKVAESWALGDSQKDTGVLLFVAYDEHEMRFEVGYGLESTLTDAKTGLIIRNVIAPNFQKGDYDAGFLQATQNVIGLVSGQEELVSPQVLNEKGENQEALETVIPAIIAIVVFCLLIFTKTGRKILFYSSFFTGGRGGHGGGHGGGHNGGGFSGGGGHFGGGGSSGRW